MRKVNPAIREAFNDPKGIGATINALAKEGKISPVAVVFRKDKKKFLFNSAWAATDWLKEHGFYTETINPDNAYDIVSV